MSNDRLYLDIHAIQTVPPSCINRDDAGRPKTAIYGGANRARVSSQAWKRAIRCMFKDELSDGNPGIRTTHVVSLIEKELVKRGFSEEEARPEAVEALKKAGIKLGTDKKENLTQALFFISSKQCENLADVVAKEKGKIVCDEPKEEKKSAKEEKSKYKEALMRDPSIDIALFGRMVADDTDLNFDAACQVAHSISTHAVRNEFDFYTAIDDFDDNAGAGYLDTSEYNSSTLYRYATVNLLDLKSMVGSDFADAAVRFVEAFIRSMPTGKQNTFANRTLPDLVYVTIRKDQPVNLCAAFEKPIGNEKGICEESKKAFAEYAKKVYDDYCNAPVKSFCIGDNVLDAQKTNLSDLLTGLSGAIKSEVE